MMGMFVAGLMVGGLVALVTIEVTVCLLEDMERRVDHAGDKDRE